MIATAFFRLSLLFKNETYQQEVDRDGNAEDRYGRPCFRNPDIQEQVEQEDMQKIVAQMRTAKSHRLSPRGLSSEGEVGAEVEVGDKADKVADGVGHIHIHKPPENSV